MRTIYSIALFIVFTLNTTLQANTQITNHITAITDCNLPAPSNLNVTNAVGKTITINWGTVSGATSYKVNVSDGLSANTLFNGIVTGNTVTVSGLKSKTTYTIKVSTVDMSGCNSPFISQMDYVILDETIIQRIGKEYDINQFNPIVSPNPFTDDLRIAIELFAGKNAVITLFDANGKLVRTQQMGEEDQTLILNTSDLSPGMYVLRFQNDITYKTYKIMKFSW
jgi:flagellar hook assembly protein FlgD